MGNFESIRHFNFCRGKALAQNIYMCNVLSEAIGGIHSVHDGMCESCNKQNMLFRIIHVAAVAYRNKPSFEKAKMFIENLCKDELEKKNIQGIILGFELEEQTKLNPHDIAFNFGLINKEEYDEIESDLLQQQAEEYQELITEVNTNE